MATVKAIDSDLQEKINSLSTRSRRDLLDFLGDSFSTDQNISDAIEKLEQSIRRRLAAQKAPN